MADTIHKKKKDWPHFDTIHLGGSAYAEGYERIFGGKKAENGKKKHEARRGRSFQETDEPVAEKGRKKSKSTRRVHRKKEVRQSKDD